MYVDTETQVMPFPEQSATSFQRYRSACPSVGKTPGATAARRGGPAPQPATLTPDRCHPLQTLMHRAEGAGGNEAPNPLRAKPGISGSRAFDQSRPCLPECVPGASAAHATAESHAARRARSHLCSASPRAALSARGTAQNLSPLLPFPRSQQPFYGKASLQRFLSLGVCSQHPRYAAARVHTGCASFPSIFLREQPGPQQNYS